MKTEQGKIFLKKIHERINEGDYDSEMIMPYMDRKLFFRLVKNKVLSKENNNSNPLLTTEEIKHIISDLRETSLNIVSLYLKLGFIEKNSNQQYDITKKGKLAIKLSVLESVGLINNE